MTAIPAPGALAPLFQGPTLDGNARFEFDTMAGFHVLLLFAGSAGAAASADALRLLARYRALFDDRRAVFFGVSSDPADVAEHRIAKQIPGIRWFLDHDRAISRLYGAVDGADADRPYWLLLDPMLRVLARASVAEGEAVLRQLADIVAEPAPDGIAPVLMVPRILDPALCRRLIALYDANGGSPSGFMRDVNGVTTGTLDDGFKRRSDFFFHGLPEVKTEVHVALQRVLLPLIRRAFQFRVTRVERDVVACYNGDGQGGHFRPHRDDTAAGTAHRRFACSINLNAEDYEGGELRFPEFGSRLYRPPTGGAAVFSCSLQHEAMPVTRGKRYVYLPFFYDEAAAQQREAIARTTHVDPKLAQYRA